MRGGLCKMSRRWPAWDDANHFKMCRRVGGKEVSGKLCVALAGRRAAGGSIEGTGRGSQRLGSIVQLGTACPSICLAWPQLGFPAAEA